MFGSKLPFRSTGPGYSIRLANETVACLKGVQIMASQYVHRPTKPEPKGQQLQINLPEVAVLSRFNPSKRISPEPGTSSQSSGKNREYKANIDPNIKMEQPSCYFQDRNISFHS